MAGYLKGLMPGVLGQLAAQQRVRLYRDDPVLWAEEYMGLKGQVWGKMRETMESVRDHYGTGVAASHGVSKSYTAGLIACWWIDTHPLGETETFVATTAPSKAQVDAVWSYIRFFHNRAAKRFEAGEIDHALPGYITSGAEVRWKLPNGDTIAQGRKPPDNKSDIAFQGRHATFLLFIGDEATGLSEDMLRAGDNIATGRLNKQLLLLNPTDPTCAAAKMWPRNDEAVQREGRKGWNFIGISMFDSPLVTLEAGIDVDKLDGMSGPATIERYREQFPEDDPQWISRVLGQWPWGNADGILFTEEVISRAMRTCVVPYAEDPMIQFGVDVARFGSDHSVVYSAELGEVWETDPETDKPIRATGRDGLRVRLVRMWRGAPITSSSTDNPGTAERVHALALAEGAVAVNVDASGLGGGVVDALRDKEDMTYELYEVYGSSTVDVDRRMYINLRAEQYFELRKRMFQGTIDLNEKDEELLNELRGIRYEEVPNGAMKIESKEDMRKRGVKSPDRADALWYAVLDLEGASGPQDGDMLAFDPEDFVDSDHFWFDRKQGIGAHGW